MTYEQLRIFVAVAERQHLTQAATALSLTPSAVSAAIKALENLHSVSLFDRVGRGIELSREGRIFLGEAKETLARFRQTRSVDPSRIADGSYRRPCAGFQICGSSFAVSAGSDHEPSGR